MHDIQKFSVYIRVYAHAHAIKTRSNFPRFVRLRLRVHLYHNSYNDVFIVVLLLHSAGLRLTERDIPRLLRQLKKHASKWREIGINLEFLPGELANIAARPNLSEGAPVSLLGALLEEWIQWAPGDSRGSTDFATLESLKTALSDSGLGAAAHGWLSVHQD